MLEQNAIQNFDTGLSKVLTFSEISEIWPI